MSEQTRVLVAVASRHGATRGIAQRIAANLERRGIETELVAAEEWATDLDGYKAVVLGSAVY